MLTRAWLCAAALLLAGCATTRLPDPAQAALARAGLPADSLGFVLQPLDGSRPALTRRAGDAMAPASTMKLVTAIVALDRLGIAHRGRTELLAAVPSALFSVSCRKSVFQSPSATASSAAIAASSTAGAESFSCFLASASGSM